MQTKRCHPKLIHTPQKAAAAPHAKLCMNPDQILYALRQTTVCAKEFTEQAAKHFILSPPCGQEPRTTLTGWEEEAAYLLSTGSHTSIWRVRQPFETVLWAKVGTAFAGRATRARPEKPALLGLAATATGQETREAVRAAIALKL